MSSKPTIWVTGASEGIGLGLLKHYQLLGWQTVGTSRRATPPDTADVWIPADLTLPDDRTHAVHQLTEGGRWPQLVVLNAGLGHWASAAETEPADAERVFALNYWAAVELTRALVAQAGERPLHIMIISSIAARFGQSQLATYSASKAAIALWAESVHHEWHGSAHRIQLILPGVVSTDIMRHSLGHDGLPLLDRAGTHRGWSVARTAVAIERASRSRKFAHILASPGVRLALVVHDLCPRLFYLLLRRKP